MSQFHTLKVQKLIKETTDAVSIIFEVPENLSQQFKFTQGQYITIRTNIQGEDQQNIDSDIPKLGKCVSSPC